MDTLSCQTSCDATWWTGKPPMHELKSLPLLDLSKCTRQTLLNYFDNTWTLTEVLFSALLGEDAFYRPPTHQLRHPLIFYYCHPAVLYVNKLRLAGFIQEGINPYFEQLFETGVDEMSWDDLSKNQLKWPTVREITEYRARVYQLVSHLIQTHPLFDQHSITMQSPAWALVMSFEHERIHLETSSVLIRELPIQFVKKPLQWPAYYPLNQDDHVEVTKWINVASQNVTIGKPQTHPSYGWDNEYGSREIAVNSFRASQSLMSNAEFLEFVRDGGYHQQRYWSEEGWQWRTFRNAKWPTFWIPEGPAGLHCYKLRLCFDIVPMQHSWPAEVNYHEAKAYCAWRTEKENASIPYRLTTEAEHHCLRDEDDNNDAMINHNLIYASPSSVVASAPTEAGFYDVFGNVWQWCEDHFAALPGFEAHSLYDDFSTPCFDGKHNVIMGGSFISTGSEASRWARFHFRRHFFQHAGFRLAQSLEEITQLETTCLDSPPPHVNSKPCCSKKKNADQNIYETQQLLTQYLLLHFGGVKDVVSYSPFLQNEIQFPQRCAQLVIEMMQKYKITPQRVLDVGCAVGGASFEFATFFSEVIGIDLSQSFIATANVMKEKGEINCTRKEEGEIFTEIKLSVNASSDRQRVTFKVGDACSLPADLGQFDAVLLANLLCRLPSPKSCLMRMGGPLGLVKPGGLLVTISPYSWLSSHTPKAAWLGGKEENGVITSSTVGLHKILDENFKLVHEVNIPLVIREHARKFEYIIAHGLVWKRN